ncbi:DNA polymerase IV [Diplonema papillatum]|nr:DNA polymerase IV [Diplonema papillatum]
MSALNFAAESRLSYIGNWRERLRGLFFAPEPAQGDGCPAPQGRAAGARVDPGRQPPTTARFARAEGAGDEVASRQGPLGPPASADGPPGRGSFTHASGAGGEVASRQRPLGPPVNADGPLGCGSFTHASGAGSEVASRQRLLGPPVSADGPLGCGSFTHASGAGGDASRQSPLGPLANADAPPGPGTRQGVDQGDNASRPAACAGNEGQPAARDGDAAVNGEWHTLLGTGSGPSDCAPDGRQLAGRTVVDPRDNASRPAACAGNEGHSAKDGDTASNGKQRTLQVAGSDRRQQVRAADGSCPVIDPRDNAGRPAACAGNEGHPAGDGGADLNGEWQGAGSDRRQLLRAADGSCPAIDPGDNATRPAACAGNEGQLTRDGGADSNTDAEPRFALSVSGLFTPTGRGPRSARLSPCTGVEHSLAAGGQYYLHVDVDCFFVSVARVLQPELAGAPVVVVSGADDWSDVCTASYEARAVGITKGMILKEARRLAAAAGLAVHLVKTGPKLFAALTRATFLLYKTVAQVSEWVHPVSCDELFACVPKWYRCTYAYSELYNASVDDASVVRLAHAIKGEVLRQTGCSVSIGISDKSRLLARHANNHFAKGGQRVRVRIRRDTPVSVVKGIGPFRCDFIGKATGKDTIQDVLGVLEVALALKEESEAYVKLTQRYDERVISSWVDELRAVMEGLLAVEGNPSQTESRADPVPSPAAAGIVTDGNGQPAKHDTEDRSPSHAAKEPNALETGPRPTAGETGPRRAEGSVVGSLAKQGPRGSLPGAHGPGVPGDGQSGLASREADHGHKTAFSSGTAPSVSLGNNTKQGPEAASESRLPGPEVPDDGRSGLASREADHGHKAAFSSGTAASVSFGNDTKRCPEAGSESRLPGTHGPGVPGNGQSGLASREADPGLKAASGSHAAPSVSLGNDAKQCSEAAASSNGAPGDEQSTLAGKEAGPGPKAASASHAAPSVPLGNDAKQGPEPRFGGQVAGRGVYCCAEMSGDTPLTALPGVGSRTWEKIKEVAGGAAETASGFLVTVGCSETRKRLCDELGAATVEALRLNATGNDTLAPFSWGLEDTLLYPPKSISRDLNWGVRPNQPSDVRAILTDLSSQLQTTLVTVNKQLDAYHKRRSAGGSAIVVESLFRKNPAVDRGVVMPASVAPSRVTMRLLIRKPGAAEPPKRLGHGQCYPWGKSERVSSVADGTLLGAALHIFRHAFEAQPAPCPVDQIRGIGLSLTVLHVLVPGADGAKAKPCVYQSIKAFLRPAKQRGNPGSEGADPPPEKQSKPADGREDVVVLSGSVAAAPSWEGQPQRSPPAGGRQETGRRAGGKRKRESLPGAPQARANRRLAAPSGGAGEEEVLVLSGRPCAPVRGAVPARQGGPPPHGGAAEGTSFDREVLVLSERRCTPVCDTTGPAAQVSTPPHGGSGGGAGASFDREVLVLSERPCAPACDTGRPGVRHARNAASDVLLLSETRPPPFLHRETGPGARNTAPDVLLLPETGAPQAACSRPTTAHPAPRRHAAKGRNPALRARDNPTGSTRLEVVLSDASAGEDAAPAAKKRRKPAPKVPASKHPSVMQYLGLPSAGGRAEAAARLRVGEAPGGPGVRVDGGRQLSQSHRGNRPARAEQHSRPGKPEEAGGGVAGDSRRRGRYPEDRGEAGLYNLLDLESDDDGGQAAAARANPRLEPAAFFSKPGEALAASRQKRKAPSGGAAANAPAPRCARVGGQGGGGLRSVPCLVLEDGFPKPGRARRAVSRRVPAAPRDEEEALLFVTSDEGSDCPSGEPAAPTTRAAAAAGVITPSQFFTQFKG